MARHNTTGKIGEEIARNYLIEKGYAIIEQNAHIGHYELDIVASKGNRIIFIEVKTRNSDTDFDPLEALNAKKIKYLCRAANSYVQAYDIPHQVQFDVITVMINGFGSAQEIKIEHYPDAFLPPLNAK